MPTYTPANTPPTLEEIQRAEVALSDRIVHTPTVRRSADDLPSLPTGSSLTVKLELFQHAGSFKTRRVLLQLDSLDETQRQRGVTAVSAGNHALAVAWACCRESIDAKLLITRNADPVRVEGCRALGAEVVLLDDIGSAFDEMHRVVESEGRTAIHPFEGRHATLGAATCGLELIHAHPDLETIVVPVGGGGLLSGVALACKLVRPAIRIVGVEPTGADSLYQSFKKGEPVALSKVNTIADSLGSPTALPYSFEICRANTNAIVRIEDDEMLEAMVFLYDELKIVAEPACAAATAAVLGPLRDQLEGQAVGVIACGSNIGERRFSDLLAKGRELIDQRDLSDRSESA